MTDLREQLQASLGTSYDVKRELTAGGMSRVFLAEEMALGRMVVIKVLSPALSAEMSHERFRREIRVAASLQHPHIVPLLTAGEADGLPYFTMPYVEGQSLRDALTSAEPPSPQAALLLLREIASALAYSHAQGVVHRDIKPENVLISAGSAMVTDFGVAKALAASARVPVETLTFAGVAIGTPTYMAPEQIAGDEATDHRADIYAFGVLAYELLTGAPPFVRRTPQALFAAHLTEAPESITRRKAAVPTATAELVMRCLEKEPGARPQSASEIVEVLGGNMPDVVAPGRSLHRLPYVRAGAVVLVMLVTALAGYRALTKHAAPVNAPDGRSIAVMPFVNVSGTASDEYFSDGMTEELIDALSKVKELRVAARSSVFALRQRKLTPPEMARELGVRSLVEGTVRRAGDRLRVSAQLVEASTGYSLWADHYDRDAKDVFAIQDEISRAIASSLRLQLASVGAPGGGAPTENVEAHNLYLEGRFFLAKRTASSIEHAIALFKQAVKIDPSYARAHAALAMSYNLLSAYTDVRTADMVVPARQAADRAIALDSMLAEAHAASGVTAFRFEWDWARAEREFMRAMVLDSTLAQPRIWYAQLLDMKGEPAAAIAQMEVARRMEPLALIVNAMSGVAMYNGRRFRDAEAFERKVIALDSSFVRSHRDLAWALCAQRRFDEAAHEFAVARALTGDVPGPEMAYLYAVSGRRAEAEAIANRLEQEEKDGRLKRGPRYGWETALPVEMAIMQGALGNLDRAFYWLERARAARILVIYMQTSPQFDPLRGDPRFAAYVARLKLSPKA